MRFRSTRATITTQHAPSPGELVTDRWRTFPSGKARAGSWEARAAYTDRTMQLTHSARSLHPRTALERVLLEATWHVLCILAPPRDLERALSGVAYVNTYALLNSLRVLIRAERPASESGELEQVRELVHLPQSA